MLILQGRYFPKELVFVQIYQNFQYFRYNLLTTNLYLRGLALICITLIKVDQIKLLHL